MKVRVEHPDFVRRRLKVEAAGWWHAPRLFQDGVRVLPRRGVHLVTTDRGETAPVRLLYNFIDPMPVLRLGQQRIQLVRPLPWHDYAWIGLPLLLVLSGGALGGVVGALAAHANGLLFRSEAPPLRRYLLTGGVTLAAALILLFLAALFRAALSWALRVIG